MLGAMDDDAGRRLGRFTRAHNRGAWGWLLLTVGVLGWALDAILTRALPQTWGGPNMASGLLVLVCLALGLVGALLVLLHHTADSGGRSD